MAIELATAYVSLTTSARGIGDSVSRELGGVRTAAGKVGDDSGKALGQGLAEGGKAGAGAFTGAFAGVGATLAGLGIADFFSDSVLAASDLNETMSKSSVIFGANAGAIDKWASTAATTMGLSRQAALESAASFGDMFSQLGIAGDKAAGMSTQVVQLAADLGSFNNLPTAEVVDMISGAFRGEYDSLQRVIPNISAARVEHEALAMTHKKSAKDLTAAEKAQATLAIVTKDGARAAGDFARTSTGLANSQKTLAAKLEDSKAKIGAGLMPVMAALAQLASEVLVPALGETFGFLLRNKDVIAPFAAAVGTLVAAWAIYATVMKVATVAQAAFNLVAALNPLGWVIVGVVLLVALIAGIVTAYKRIGWFRDAVNAAWEGIKTAAGAVKDAVVAAWNGIGAALTWVKDNVLKPVADFFVGLWQGIAAGAQWLYANVLAPLGQAFAAAFGFVTGILRSFANLWSWLVSQVIGWAVTQIRGHLAVLGAGFTWLNTTIIQPVWNAVRTATQAVVNAIAAAFRWLWTNALQPIWNAIRAAFSALAAGVKAAYDAVIKPVINAFAAAAAWLRGAVSTAFGAVMGIVRSVGATFRDVFGAISGYISRAFSGAVGIVRGALNGIISLINGAIAGMNGVISAANEVPGVDFPSLPSIPHLARGGALGAGWSVVGEAGPELVHKAGASVRVFSSSKSLDMLGAAGGGAMSVGKLVEINGPVHVRSDQDILELSRGIARESARKLRALGVGVSLSGANA